MREIKFRAWQKNHKHMVKVTRIDFKNNLLTADYGEETIPRYNCFSLNNFELMQYTGLKDKNGNEIYEGDIVLANGSNFIIDHDMSDARKYVNGNIGDISHYEKGRFKFVCKWDTLFCRFSFYTNDRNKQIRSDISKRDYEVIGNMWENTDLLEATP